MNVKKIVCSEKLKICNNISHCITNIPPAVLGPAVLGPPVFGPPVGGAVKAVEFRCSVCSMERSATAGAIF